MDIFRTWMHFLRANVTFYNAVNMICDVIRTANPFPYTAKFMFVEVRNDNSQEIRHWKINRISIYSVVMYKKYLNQTWLGEMIIFSPRARK